jgi:hypothetical protein
VVCGRRKGCVPPLLHADCHHHRRCCRRRRHWRCLPSVDDLPGPLLPPCGRCRRLPLLLCAAAGALAEADPGAQ